MAEKASRKDVLVTAEVLLAEEDKKDVVDVVDVDVVDVVVGVVVVVVVVDFVCCCWVEMGTSRGRSRCQACTPREM